MQPWWTAFVSFYFLYIKNKVLLEKIKNFFPEFFFGTPSQEKIRGGLLEIEICYMRKDLLEKVQKFLEILFTELLAHIKSL